MEDIRMNLEKINTQIKEAAEGCGRNADDILLVAVSKTRTPEEINVAIDAGATDIGENKVQEIMDKYDAVKPVRWHMIGHLQTNKVKYIIDKVSMIHSVDSYKLAVEIDKRAKNHGITMDILIQVNSAQEESKFGITTDETEKLIKDILTNCENIRIRGLMCIAPLQKILMKSKCTSKKLRNSTTNLVKSNMKDWTSSTYQWECLTIFRLQ